MEQRPPYPPLTQATAHEPVTTLEHVSGTLAGFRTPSYEQGISVAGYHLHYLTDDRRHGGHALDFDSSSRAALIYLHSTSDRQRQLAESVALRVQSELSKPDKTKTNRVARVWHDSESTDGDTP